MLKIPALIFAALAVLTLGRARRDIWYLPVLCMLLFAGMMLPFSANIAHSLKPTKQLLLYCILTIGTLAFIRTVRQAIPILMMVLVLQFVWWGMLGAPSGLVRWDEKFGNYDSFGALMVMGITSAIYAGFAVRSKRFRLIAFCTAGLCLVGLVSSFARGAFLAAALVVIFGWIRAPRKGIATLGLVAAAAVVALTGQLFFANVSRGPDTNPNFLKEMLTVQENVTEGTGKGTERKLIWAAAWKVFLARPLFGVGLEAFGPFAASHIRRGELGNQPRARNPLMLYDRAVHNMYLQTLAEGGVVGMGLFLWLLVDFWRRNLHLKRPSRVSAWDAACGGKYDLRALATAAEAAMVGFLTTGLFYNQLLEVNWLWSLVTVNLLLHRLSVQVSSKKIAKRRSHPRPFARA